jgi:hypothetical protein
MPNTSYTIHSRAYSDMRETQNDVISWVESGNNSVSISTQSASAPNLTTIQQPLINTNNSTNEVDSTIIRWASPIYNATSYTLKRFMSDGITPVQITCPSFMMTQNRLDASPNSNSTLLFIDIGYLSGQMDISTNDVVAVFCENLNSFNGIRKCIDAYQITETNISLGEDITLFIDLNELGGNNNRSFSFQLWKASSKRTIQLKLDTLTRTLNNQVSNSFVVLSSGYTTDGGYNVKLSQGTHQIHIYYKGIKLETFTDTNDINETNVSYTLSDADISLNYLHLTHNYNFNNTQSSIADYGFGNETAIWTSSQDDINDFTFSLGVLTNLRTTFNPINLVTNYIGRDVVTKNSQTTTYVLSTSGWNFYSFSEFLSSDKDPNTGYITLNSLLGYVDMTNIEKIIIFTKDLSLYDYKIVGK